MIVEDGSPHPNLSVRRQRSCQGQRPRAREDRQGGDSEQELRTRRGRCTAAQPSTKRAERNSAKEAEYVRPDIGSPAARAQQTYQERLAMEHFAKHPEDRIKAGLKTPGIKYQAG